MKASLLSVSVAVLVMMTTSKARSGQCGDCGLSSGLVARLPICAGDPSQLPVEACERLHCRTFPQPCSKRYIQSCCDGEAQGVEGWYGCKEFNGLYSVSAICCGQQPEWIYSVALDTFLLTCGDEP